MTPFKEKDLEVRIAGMKMKTVGLIVLGVGVIIVGGMFLISDKK